MRSGWRVGHLAREAVLNVFSPASRLLFVAVLALLLGNAVGALALSDVGRLRSSVDTLALRGSSVVALSASDAESSTTIGRASCENLSRFPGVARAGLLILGGRTAVFPLGTEVSVFRASTTLFPRLAHHSALVGSAVSTRSQWLRIDGVTVYAERLSPQPEGLTANSSIITPLEPTDASAPTCVVIADPYADIDEMIPSLVAQVDVAGGSIAGARSLTNAPDPVGDFLGRATRFAPLIAGVFGGIATGLVILSRSSEAAAYRMSGTRPAAMWSILGFESVIFGGLATGSCLTLMVLGGFPDNALGGGTLRALSMGAIWVWIAAMFAFGLAFRSPNDLAKQR